jgi:MFS family permease
MLVPVARGRAVPGRDQRCEAARPGGGAGGSRAAPRRGWRAGVGLSERLVVVSVYEQKLQVGPAEQRASGAKEAAVCTRLGPVLREALEPLSEREFRLLFFGRTVSLFGSAFAPIALAFAVLDLTGSASDLGLVVAAGFVPQVFFLLVGGIWADRLPRHHVMVVSDLVAGAAQAAIAALVLAGVAEIWHLVVLQVVRGVATSFFFPASQGIVPETVSARLLQQANALLRLTRNGTQIGGTAAGGILVAAVGSGWALAFDAATYFLGAAFLLALRLPRSVTMPERHFVRELREGWDAFRSRAWLWGIVVQFAFVNAAGVGAWSVLGPVAADEELGGAAAWGLILAAQSAGFIVGGVFTLRFRPDRILLVATLAIFPMAVPILLLAAPAPAVVIALVAFGAGFGIEIFGVFWDVAMQQQIPADQLSRVYSYDALGSFVFIPLGAAVAGPVAEQVGVAETLVGATVVIVVATALVLLIDEVRNLRRTDLVPAAA